MHCCRETDQITFVGLRRLIFFFRGGVFQDLICAILRFVLQSIYNVIPLHLNENLLLLLGLPIKRFNKILTSYVAPGAGAAGIESMSSCN
jgi:hypothetical protein